MGVASLALLGAFSLQNLSARTQQQLGQMLDTTQIDAMVQRILRDTTSCMATVSGRDLRTSPLTPGLSLRDRTGAAILSPGQKYGAFQIENINLRNLQLQGNISGQVYFADFFIQLGKTNNGRTHLGSAMIEKAYRLRVVLNAANGHARGCSFSEEITTGAVTNTTQDACTALGGTWNTTTGTCALTQAICESIGGTYNATLTPPCGLPQNSPVPYYRRKGSCRISATPTVYQYFNSGSVKWQWRYQSDAGCNAVCRPDEFIKIDPAYLNEPHYLGFSFVEAPCPSGSGMCKCPFPNPDGTGCEEDRRALFLRQFPHEISVGIIAGTNGTGPVPLVAGPTPAPLPPCVPTPPSTTCVTVDNWAGFVSQPFPGGYRGSAFSFHYVCERYR